MSPSAADPARVLVRGVNWLGDAVMTTPALARLRERYPGAHFTMLCHEKLRGLWTGHPAIDEVATFGDGDGPFGTGRRLRPGKYDLSVIFPNSYRSAIESFVAGIPRRIGAASPLRGLLLTDRVAAAKGIARMRKRTPAEVRRLLAPGAPPPPAETIPPGSHQIHHYLRIVAALGADEAPVPTRLAIPPDEARGMAEALIGPRQDDEAWIGINPGAEYGPAKRWPVDRFAEAASLLLERGRCRFVVFGGRGDLVLAGQFARRMTRAPVVVLAGRTSLRELLAGLAACDVLLTNDTGPMHVAAALGVPVVVPFGSTSPGLTGPGLPGDPRHAPLRAGAACAPCFLRQCPADFRCMKGIGAGDVAAAAARALAAAGRPGFAG
jgi:heptosyltransferase-2